MNPKLKTLIRLHAFKLDLERNNNWLLHDVVSKQVTDLVKELVSEGVIK